MRTEKKLRLLQARRGRQRKKIIGTRSRPRMSVRFTGKNIYVQFIDDTAGHTLVAASTNDKSLPDRDKLRANVSSAIKIGQLAGQAAREQKIEQVVFDRSGARYHGKVKALADAAREAGLKF